MKQRLSSAEFDLNPTTNKKFNASQSLAARNNMDQIAPTATDKLRRFCYLGNIEVPIYAPTSFDLTAEFCFETLRELCASVSDTELVECLSSVLGVANAEQLPRRDEALLVLAVYLSLRTDDKQRTLVRGHFAELVVSDKDLFVFTKFAKQVQKIMARKTPLSRTMRKAVLEWYRKQPLDKLLHMWSVGDRDLCMHRDLLHICHYKSETFECDILAALHLLCTPLKELIKWPSNLEPLAECKAMILGIAKLRLVQKATLALPIVKELSLCFEHVPRHVLTDQKLVNFLIPKMSYEQLLLTWPSFFSLYKTNRTAQRNYTEVFFEESKLRAANVAPISLLLQEARNAKHKKVVLKGVVTAKPPTFMYSLYKRSFGFNKALGLRLHITLNLEMCYIGKSLTGRLRSIKYLDAVVGLAFGYYKCDPQVNVQIWHDKSGKLKALPWTPEMSVDEAKACCENQKIIKIKQTLTDVINSAMLDMERVYDVFLVLVPCATRGNVRNKSDHLCHWLDIYRLKRNKDAKFIIMSNY